MPEGDAVLRAARRLDRALAGSRITRTDLRVPRWATVDLTGTTVVGVGSYGKHLLLRFDDGRTLRTHFRMEGTWRLFDAGAPWRGGPGHQIRVVLGTAQVVAVGYRLSDVEVVPTRDESLLLGHLGPDILGPSWDQAEALRRLRAEPDTAVFEALLDQRNLAGIGTIYACEALHETGTGPATSIGSLADLTRIIETARELMLDSVRDDQPGRRDRRRHRVHGRGGRPCYRCGSTLLSEERGRWGRRATWCPQCQT